MFARASRRSPIQLFIAIAILLATATVAAQVYKWVDKDGQVQYTDAPPQGASKAEAKKVETSAPVASTTSTPTKTLQDRAKDYDKRRTDVADSAKKAEATQKNDEIAEENCKSARAGLRDLERTTDSTYQRKGRDKRHVR
ncbi:MAG: DUF4124 domain-containing protein [Betaproteobacteria bacterium]|nr:DUF4124 domain-containing protein [Betaproteobacteria bacterium]